MAHPMPRSSCKAQTDPFPRTGMESSTIIMYQDDWGLAPDVATSKCEDAVVKAAAMANGRFTKTTAALFAKGGCPARVQVNAPSMSQQLESTLDQMNGQAYCAGTVPLP